MNLKSCTECGLVYDINNIKLPIEEDIKRAEENGLREGVLEWSETKCSFTPVFKCCCGEFVSV
jgi:hypothetical protein